MEPAAPTPAELTAYLSGSLPKDRFTAIDLWLEQLPDDEVSRILEDAESRMPSVRISMPQASPPDPGFIADL